MTVSNSQKPQNYVLELCFAAEQVTESLQFCFYDEKGNRCEQVGDGPLASTFNFSENDEIKIKVMATSGGNPNKRGNSDFSMKINDCSLVSIPELGVEDISMFDPINAVTSIANWIPLKSTTNPENGRVTIEMESKKSLVVKAQNGQWKVSGYLSINQTLNGKTENKLYYFDPESSAGFGWPQ